MAWPFSRRRDPEFIGSDAPDAFYSGRFRDEQTGAIGPKMQIPGTEPMIIACP